MRLRTSLLWVPLYLLLTSPASAESILMFSFAGITDAGDDVTGHFGVPAIVDYGSFLDVPFNSVLDLAFFGPPLSFGGGEWMVADGASSVTASNVNGTAFGINDFDFTGFNAADFFNVSFAGFGISLFQMGSDSTSWHLPGAVAHPPLLAGDPIYIPLLDFDLDAAELSLIIPYGGVTRARFYSPFGGGTLTSLVGPTQVEPIPEPTSLLLLGTGVAGLMAARRKRRLRE